MDQQSVHHEIQPRKPMIDICNLGQFAPVFQFFPQTLAAPVLTVEMGKFGVTSYYVNDHAKRIARRFSNGYTLPSCQSNNDSFAAVFPGMEIVPDR